MKWRKSGVPRVFGVSCSFGFDSCLCRLQARPFPFLSSSLPQGFSTWSQDQGLQCQAVELI